jgi:hypothetical protein
VTISRTIVELPLLNPGIYYGPLFDEGSRSHIYHGQNGSVGISEKNLGLMDTSDIMMALLKILMGELNL